ncbi:MAG: GatB/YqeY domain-containing protein [Armatimonadetes bacterium]|nr:GatB/YqeY domain-containing protein [Armatimonadota bacterium]
MSLRDAIQAAYNDSLRARDEARVRTLRLLRAALKDADIEARGSLDEAGVIRVVQRQAKQRQESIEAYRQGGRDDLVARESEELAILSTFLPELLGDDELRALCEAAVAEAGASSPQQIGAVMKLVMPRLQGRADGRRVNALVRELLGG